MDLITINQLPNKINDEKKSVDYGKMRIEKWGGSTWRFDERKNFILISKEEINSKFKNNKFIKYFKTGSNGLSLPPGTYIYRDKNSIISRKPFFFKFTIKIKPKTDYNYKLGESN